MATDAAPAPRAPTAEPIFVVGVPRSGTTLLAALLAAHSRLSCGPETGFFSALAAADVRRLLDRRRWPGPAVEFLGRMQPGGGGPVPESFGLPRAALEGFLARRRPAVPALLAALAEQHMQRLGKARWVEKTPGHLARVALIRRHFPRSPIVRIVRDPRDVALSLMQVPWGVGTFLEGLLFWRGFDDQRPRFFEADGRSLTIRFEDLVAEPAATLGRVCRFLGEAFEEGMLDTAGSSAQVRRDDEPWKAKVGSEIDAGRGAAWRTRLAPEDVALAAAVVGDRLAAYGYAPGGEGGPGRTFVRIHPLRREAAPHEALLRALARRGGRFWPSRCGEVPAAAYYLGAPGGGAWVGHRSGERLLNTARIAADVLRARSAGRPVHWEHDDGRGRLGLCAGLLSFLLRRAAAAPARVAPAEE